MYWASTRRKWKEKKSKTKNKKSNCREKRFAWKWHLFLRHSEEFNESSVSFATLRATASIRSSCGMTELSARCQVRVMPRRCVIAIQSERWPSNDNNNQYKQPLRFSAFEKWLFSLIFFINFRNLMRLGISRRWHCFYFIPLPRPNEIRRYIFVEYLRQWLSPNNEW